MRINFDVLGFIVLFFALILMGVLQVAGALGAMYVLHQTRPFPELLLRWGAIALPGMFGYLITTWIFGGSGQVMMVLFFCVISFPVIWGLYYAKEHVTEALYGQFDFNNFQRVTFNELVMRLAVMFLPLTLVLHMFDYLFVGRQINRHPKLVGFLLFVLEVAGIAAGYFFVLRLEWIRAAILTAVSAILYFAILWYLAGRGMLY